MAIKINGMKYLKELHSCNRELFNYHNVIEINEK